MAKRILAILVVCVLAVSVANPLIAVDTTSAGTVARTTLMELFTATWCPPCAMYGPNADRAYDELGPQQVILLRDQVSQDGLDTDETNARANFYGVTGVPTLYLNGTYAYIADYSGFVQRIRDMNSVAAQFQVSVSAQVQGATSQGAAAIEVRSLTSSGYGNLHLIVALFEKVVAYEGTNGVKTHRFVVRDYLFGETGEQVSLAGFQTRQFSYPLALPNGSSPGDFGIAAWIQDFSTKEVLQAESADIAVAGQGQYIVLSPSWNLVSVAVPLPVSPIPGLQAVYGYHDGWSAPPTLLIGGGYWVQVQNAVTVPLPGTPLTAPVSITYLAGWQLLGNPFDVPLPISSNITNHEYITTCYSYDPLLGWDIVDPIAGVLESGKGYWIYLTTATTLMLTYP